MKRLSVCIVAVIVGGSVGIARVSTLGDPIPRIQPRNFAPKPPQVCMCYRNVNGSILVCDGTELDLHGVVRFTRPAQKEQPK